MAAFDAAPAAKLIVDAMRSGKRLTELPEACRPRTIPEGYDIQDGIAAEVARSDNAAERPAGWKLGIGSKNAMKGAGVDRPLIGRMFAGRFHPDGAAVAAPAGAKALIEIEIAFTLSRDVSPTETIPDPLAVVAKTNFVSEIVLSRFVDRTKVGLPSFAADSVGFHALVIGREVQPSQIASIARSLKVLLDGKETVMGATGDDAIDPVAMLGALLRHARDRGITLKKGEVVTTGTLSKPFDAVVPCHIEAKADGLGLAYTLKGV
jgi:2-keto-4-pentenoate hydratase